MPEPVIETDSPSLLARWVALIVVVLSVVPGQLHGHMLHSSLLALTGLVAVLCLCEGNHASLGLKFAPVQGWLYWVKIALLFGLCIAVLSILLTIVFVVNSWTIPLPSHRPSVTYLLHVCVYAPVTEEVIYRSLLIMAVLPTLGKFWTIVCSGIVFALCHVLAGNPGPDNQIAGFMLAWAFLHSRTILVPLAMHAAGNFIAFAVHAANWYGMIAIS